MNATTLSQVKSRIDEGQSIFQTALKTLEMPDEDKETRYCVSVFLSETAICNLFIAYAEENSIELAQEFYDDVRTLYNELKSSAKIFNSTELRSNIGILSSWHSDFAMIINGEKLSPAESSATAISAANRIYEYFVKKG